nr:hypothetical protein [uncultured Sphaerochaeta sp.]
MKDTWPVKDGRTCTRRRRDTEARNVEGGQGGHVVVADPGHWKHGMWKVAERVWDV